MRTRRLSSLGLLVLLAAGGSAAGSREAAVSGPVAGWLPEACVLTLDVESILAGEKAAESDDARWNRFYRRGMADFGRDDFAAARVSFCLALESAASFGPRDYRFAETLDELGLVGYLAEDYAFSEAMQGAATAEMLLALGPPAADLTEEAGNSCKSSVATYMTRLGWIFDRLGRGEDIEPLMREPYRILERGYVPFDSLQGRLDWLIGRYLLAEDFAAADRLSALRGEITPVPELPPLPP